MENSSIYVLHKNNKNILMYNGVELTATSTKDSNTLGTIIRDKTLFINGANIATSSTNTDFHVVNDELFFGNVNLSNPAECINITQTDYNKLLKGVPVAGYKRYNKSAIYNIVDDVDQADTITYTIDNGVITFSDNTVAVVDSNILYNNTSGDLTENALDSDETVTNTKCPFVVVKHFNAIIEPESTIKLTYYVDAQNMDALTHENRSDTFTVIIKTKEGKTPVTKTTYAGLFTLETPSFDVEGETWFSIECIDSNGVGSVVQYFDILVRDTVIPNHYVMQAGDLETYGIAINDNTQAKALANKAALSNFFADVKSGEIDGSNGYNGVKMLNGTYWIDYHAVDGYGTQTYYNAIVDTNSSSSTYKKVKSVSPCTEEDAMSSGVWCAFSTDSAPTVGKNVVSYVAAEDQHKELQKMINNEWIKNNHIYYVINTSKSGDNIVFPDGFTVDLNEGTIKAIASTDLASGVVIDLTNNFDTHIINGTVSGNYDIYDWELNKFRVGSPNPSEWLHVTGGHKARYCSFVDLVISESLGYESGIGGDHGSDGNTPSFTYNKRIDSDGSIIDADGYCITQQYTINDGCDEVKFGRWGYCGYYMGKHREVFYSFYDANEDFICTIKSKLYFSCKIPNGAKYVIMTGYGSEAEDFKLNTDNGWLCLWTNSKNARNVTYKNCTWKNTRTCALAPTIVKGLVYDSCTFENVAKQGGKYGITTMLADFEDGWQSIQNVAVINCKVKGTEGSNKFFMHFCNGLTFCNNDGIRFENSGGLEHGFIINNTIPKLSIARNVKSIHPFVYYRNNNIDSVTISYTNDRSIPGVSVRDQDKVEPSIYMEDTTIKDKCSYRYLKLRSSMNGNVWND